MSVSEFCCIAIGMLFNALTFVLGCSVGIAVSQKRKDSHHDRDRYEEDGFQYYDPPGKD
jgi:hypothetical protein